MPQTAADFTGFETGQRKAVHSISVFGCPQQKYLRFFGNRSVYVSWMYCSNLSISFDFSAPPDSCDNFDVRGSDHINQFLQIITTFYQFHRIILDIILIESTF